MKLNRKHLCLCLLIIVVGAPGIVAAEDHHHAPAQPQHPSLSLNHGKKWPTDAPLRKGMEGIGKLSMAMNSPRELSQDDGKLVSSKIDEHLKAIFKDCKLDPKADTELHKVLVRIMDGSRTLKSDSSAERKAAAQKIAAALQDYGKHFDHPGWT